MGNKNFADRFLCPRLSGFSLIDHLITYERRPRGCLARAVACPFFLTFCDWTVSCKSVETCKMSQKVVDMRYPYVLIRRVV